MYPEILRIPSTYHQGREGRQGDESVLPLEAGMETPVVPVLGII